MKCLIGIDIGTTNIKVAAYSICGELIKIVKRRMKVYHSRQEYSEYNPTYIWNKVCSCLQEVLSSKNIKQVEAIGISSMGEAGVPVDNKGNPLADIITWYDKRTTPQVKKLINIFGEKYLYNTSGQFISEKYGLNKVLWFKENRPELFKLIHKWLSMEDYIVYCLTGEFATDYSIASRTMAFDINKLGWADAILEELDIPECIFPEAYSGGKVVGQVNGIAAKETNLDKGIPVVLGGHDHACASIGVNVFDQKVILNSMGTAEVTMFAVKDFNPLIRNQGLSIYPHCGNLLYRVISSIQACGGSIEWFLNNFGTELKETSRDDHKNIYEKMMDEVIKSSSGVSGLLYIPYIRGKIGHPHVRGAFVGIKDNHSFKDFSRALIEGLSFELKEQLESSEKIFNNRFEKIRVVGGAAKSDLWMQIKANIIGRNIEVPQNEEAATFGAAILAGYGVGVYSNLENNINKLYKPKNEYRNDKGEQELWENRYLYYLDVVNDLYKLYKKYNY